MRIYLTLIMLLIPMLSQAQDCPDSPAMIANECLINKLNNAEAALAKNYSELQSAIPINEFEQAQKAKALLTKSEDAWLSYRNTYCVYKAFIEGGAGSYKTMREYECLLQLTQQRAAELANLRKHDYE